MESFSGPEERAGAVLDLTSPEFVIELTELEGRLHVLGGLLDVSSRFPQVNETIQYAPDRDSALEALQGDPFCYTLRPGRGYLEHAHGLAERRGSGAPARRA